MPLARVFALIVGLALALPVASFAHARGEDYVFLNFHPDRIEGLFEVHFDDLREKLGIEVRNGDPTAQMPQVEQTAPRVQEYLTRGFSIGPVGGAPYELEFLRRSVVELPQGAFAQYHFSASTGPLPDQLAVSHSMFYEDDRLHRGLLMVEYNAKTDTTYPGEYTALIFSRGNAEQELDLTDIPSILAPRDMIYQGMLHIWIGIDHILFLLALMLPTVLTLRNGDWQPVDRFRGAFFNLLKIVTVFTFAHSVTLLLAALDFVSVPSRLVESMIALSIVLVAINNIVGKVRDGGLLIILALGLFHGLGFASVMGHLPFRMVDLLRSVVGFNIGVELGQLAIVAVLFPVLFFLRKSRHYQPLVLKGVSVVLAAVALWWFLQRAAGFG